MEIREGAVVDELAVRLSEPLVRAELLAKCPGLLDAQSYAFAVMGVMSSVISLAAAVLMLVDVRRMRATGTHDAGERATA